MIFFFWNLAYILAVFPKLIRNSPHLGISIMYSYFVKRIRLIYPFPPVVLFVFSIMEKERGLSFPAFLSFDTDCRAPHTNRSLLTRVVGLF